MFGGYVLGKEQRFLYQNHEGAILIDFGICLSNHWIGERREFKKQNGMSCSFFHQESPPAVKILNQSTNVAEHVPKPKL